MVKTVIDSNFQCSTFKYLKRMSRKHVVGTCSGSAVNMYACMQWVFVYLNTRSLAWLCELNLTHDSIVHTLGLCVLHARIHWFSRRQIQVNQSDRKDPWCFQTIRTSKSSLVLEVCCILALLHLMFLSLWQFVRERQLMRDTPFAFGLKSLHALVLE